MNVEGVSGSGSGFFVVYFVVLPKKWQLVGGVVVQCVDQIAKDVETQEAEQHWYGIYKACKWLNERIQIDEGGRARLHNGCCGQHSAVQLGAW